MKTVNISPVREWRNHDLRALGWNKEGTLISWSIVSAGPAGMNIRTPYIVGLIEIEDKRLTAQITDVSPDELHAGMKLTGRIRRLFDVVDDQVIVYGVKFVPAPEKL